MRAGNIWLRGRLKDIRAVEHALLPTVSEARRQGEGTGITVVEARR